MYRDNLEALRQRVRDLDRSLAAHPAPLPPTKLPFPWKRLRTMVTWLAAGWLLLVLGFARDVENARLLHDYQALQAHMRLRPQAPTALQLLTAHRTSGGECLIMLSPPCRASITCSGTLIYQGSGTCRDGRYVDPADSWLDGTPQCVVDLGRKRVMVRDISCHRRSGDDYPTLWQVDLELP